MKTGQLFTASQSHIFNSHHPAGATFDDDMNQSTHILEYGKIG